MNERTAQDIIGILFIVFILIPGVFIVLSYIRNPSRSHFVEAFTDLVLPWWLPIALMSGMIFVIMSLFLTAIDAEDVL